MNADREAARGGAATAFAAAANRFRRTERLLVGTGAVLLFLGAWEALAESGLIDPLFISSPSRIAAVAFSLRDDPDLLRDLAVSGREFALGYAAAIGVGIPLGLAIGWYRRARYMLNPFIDMLNAVPRVTFLPILVLWFGIGIWSKVAVVFLGALVPVVISTHDGVHTSEARFIKVARSFQASRLKLFTSIVLPGCVPFLFSGLRFGAGRALLGVVVGELYASTDGIGHMIADAGNTFQTDTLFFGIAVITAAGLLVDAVLSRMERHAERWRPAEARA